MASNLQTASNGKRLGDFFIALLLNLLRHGFVNQSSIHSPSSSTFLVVVVVGALVVVVAEDFLVVVVLLPLFVVAESFCVDVVDSVVEPVVSSISFD